MLDRVGFEETLRRFWQKILEKNKLRSVQDCLEQGIENQHNVLKRG